MDPNTMALMLLYHKSSALLTVYINLINVLQVISPCVIWESDHQIWTVFAVFPAGWVSTGFCLCFLAFLRDLPTRVCPEFWVLFFVSEDCSQLLSVHYQPLYPNSHLLHPLVVVFPCAPVPS